MTDFKTLPAKVQAHLARLSDTVSNVVPIETRTWTIHTKNLSVGGPEPEIIQEAREWYKPNHRYLYAIKIISRKVDLRAIYDQYFELKKPGKPDRYYAKLNQESEWLYVGGSRRIYHRLKDHLGYGSKGTWAMHLAYWANSMDIEIRMVPLQKGGG